MNVYPQASLKEFHTFSVSASCDYLVEVTSLEELISCYQNPEWASLPKLVLGKGSNMLFTEHFHGVVIVNRLMGKSVSESSEAFHLHIMAGEDWPNLVEWSLAQGYFGLENLALIPGCAGSSPIQNIGAYGVELKDVCEYVDYLCLDSFEVKRLSQAECRFGYRDSVFKHELKGRAVIVAVGLSLAKSWQPNTAYGPLQALSEDKLTPELVYQTICEVRMSKLPDPAKQGNAGSFFKNPVVSQQQFEQLKQQHPGIVGYQTAQGVKLAAGWLIDRCGLKGTRCGGAMVHANQALVLVNQQNATAEDVLRLAELVTDRVKQSYGVSLEHEVRFMGASEETDLQAWIKQGK